MFAGTQGPFGTRLISGREADPNRPNEFLASKSVVASLGLKLGSHLDLVTLTQKQADGSGFNVAFLVGLLSYQGWRDKRAGKGRDEEDG